MEKIRYIAVKLLTISLTLTTVSCSDYLKVDKYFKDTKSTGHIFSDKENTMQWLSFCYDRLQGDNIETEHSDICPTNFSDNQTFNEGEAGERYRRFKLGEYGYGCTFQDYYTDSWPWVYDAIRQASIFSINAHATEELSQKRTDDLKGQARFLRAYFYWLLIREYDPIPIIPTEGADYTKSCDKLSCPRNTFDDCADFIAEEMILTTKDLPEKRDNQNIARPTKEAALTVRAKVLAHATGPFYSGNTEMADFVDKQDNQFIS